MFGIHLNHQQNRSLVVNVACSNPLQIHLLVIGRFSPHHGLPPQTHLPHSASLFQNLGSPLFPPHPDLYTVAKKKEKEVEASRAGSTGQGSRALPFPSHVFSCQPNFSQLLSFFIFPQNSPLGLQLQQNAAARLSAAPPSAASPSCFTFAFECVTPEMLHLHIT